MLLMRSAVLESAVVLDVESDPAELYLSSLASGSQRAMRGALRTLATLLTGRGDVGAVPWQVVTFAHASAVRTALANKYAPATANRILAALRGVMRAAFQLRLIDSDELARVSLVKAVRGSRVVGGRALTNPELRALFAACNPEKASGARDAALLALLYAGGLRRSEVVSVDIDDLDVSTGRLLVHGKGARERTLYLGNIATAVIRAWLARRGGGAGPVLLPVNRADRIVCRRMTDQAVAERLRVLQRRAGVAHFTAHDCRRSFVSSCLENGVDLATVQATAGHASPVTTSRYDRRFDRAKKLAATLHDLPSVA